MPGLDLNSYFGRASSTAAAPSKAAETAAAIDANPAKLIGVIGGLLFAVYLFTRR